MTSNKLIERALRRIEPQPSVDQLPALRTALRTQIDAALRLLAEQNLSQLRKTFTVTASSGEASLATPLAATEPLIMENLKRAQVYVTGYTQAAQWKADRSSLSQPATTQFAYWTLENQSILIRTTSLTAYNGDVTIRNAPYVPLLANVPASLEPLLVELLAKLYGGHRETITQVATTDRR